MHVNAFGIFLLFLRARTKQKFPDTKSVIEDEATNVATRLRDAERRKKRKADAISKNEEGMLSV